MPRDVESCDHPQVSNVFNLENDAPRFCNVVQTPLEKIETLIHESFRGSTLYKQQVRILRSRSQMFSGHSRNG